MKTDDAFWGSEIESRLAALDRQTERGKSGTAIVTLDQQSVGRLSRMDALQNQAMAKAQNARRAQEMRRLKAALLRLSEGEFGYCESCGDAIAEARLRLDPSAARCMSCASS